MSFSVVITTSIMIISMIVVLVTLANFIITYAVNMNKVLELKSIESNSQKAVLLIDNVSVEDSCITFRLRNLGPTSVLISSTSTLLVDYYTNETLEHVVEVLHYSISWYVSELIIGNNSYVVMSVGAVELRPGVIAIAKAFLSSTPSPNHVIVLVLTDDKGVRTEYVFTYG